MFSFDTMLFNDSIYNIYYKLTNKDTKYKIVENKELLKPNNYYKDDISNYVHNTDNLIASNKQDLINIYYSALNNGYEKLTFYCDEAYASCLNDISLLNFEDSNFSYTNQLVNVYNSYSSIESSYTSESRIEIKINKKYSEEDINRIDKRINDIINDYKINNYQNIKDKIKAFHDYLAAFNTYDNDMAENGKSDYHSDSAVGALLEGKAICSGYTDALSIFLDKLGIENTRVASKNHVWNAVKLNNTWYHIDMTWDDPIVIDGSNIIQYDYFMITTKELNNKNDNEHEFNKDVYNFL